MKRLWSKLYLWFHGYCTKHGIPKQGVFYMYGVDYFCPQCKREADERCSRRLIVALENLGHKAD